MNTMDADYTQISRVIPDTIENATMICLPQFTQDEFEKDVRRTVPSAVHYCENAMVIADSRRIKRGDSIILNLEHVKSGEVAGSNELKNIFLIFRGDIRINGGNFTTNRFKLFNPFFQGRIIGGSNATNILDMSQSTDFDLVDMKFAKRSCLRGRFTATLSLSLKVIDDSIDGSLEFRNYYYAGRPKMRDHVSCFTACKNQEILIDSGRGGASHIDTDTVRNCNQIILSPFTEVTGVMSDYTIYVKTNGYNGTDLYSSINIEQGSVVLIFPEIELISQTSEMIYSGSENALMLKMKFGERNENLLTLKIQKYIHRSASEKSIYSMLDKHGSNIIPRIPQRLQRSVNVDSFELHSGCSGKCSGHDLNTVNAHFNEILSTTKEYKVLSTIRDDKNDKNFVFGSQYDDVIYMDAKTAFARGGRGRDIYVIEDMTKKRLYKIDNSADDNELDAIFLTNVPTKYSIKKCDLFIKSIETTIHVVNYLQNRHQSHIIFMDKRGETFIPRVQAQECTGSTVFDGDLVRFIHATPTQNMFFLQKDFDGEHIIINAIASDLQVYKYKYDVLVVRDGTDPLIIKIQDFYMHRTKWEAIKWSLYNNNEFSRYYGLIFDNNEIIDFKEKINRDYVKVFKEYATDFSYSDSISHNHMYYIDDRVGLLKLENISPKRVKASRDGTDLVLIDRQSKNKIRIKDWDAKSSHRISRLEFNAALEPITIRGFDRISLKHVQEMQSLIDKAAQNDKNQDKFTFLADVGVKCLISINGFAKRNSTYRCGGFSSIEEQIRFTEEHCTLEQLISFRENSTTNQVLALLHKLQIDMFLDGYSKNVTDYCTGKLLLSKSAEAVQLPLETNYKLNLAIYLLYIAVKDGNHDVVKKLFEGNHVSAEDKDEEGRVPLHWAAKYGGLDIVKYLLSKYAFSFKVKDHRGRTPLHYSSEFGHADVFQYFVDQMADINIVDNNGKRPVDLATKKNTIDVVKQGQLDKDLLVACRNDIVTVTRLIEQGANPNAKDGAKRSALHYAAFEGKLNIVKYLLQQKADINNGDIDNKTPLDQVFRHIIISSKWKPSPSKFFKVPDFDALLDCADYLIAKSGTINVKDQQLKAVKELAGKKPHANVVRFLQNYS